METEADVDLGAGEAGVSLGELDDAQPLLLFARGEREDEVAEVVKREIAVPAQAAFLMAYREVDVVVALGFLFMPVVMRVANGTP